MQWQNNKGNIKFFSFSNFGTTHCSDYFNDIQNKAQLTCIVLPKKLVTIFLQNLSDSKWYWLLAMIRSIWKDIWAELPVCWGVRFTQTTVKSISSSCLIIINVNKDLCRNGQNTPLNFIVWKLTLLGLIKLTLLWLILSMETIRHRSRCHKKSSEWFGTNFWATPVLLGSLKNLYNKGATSAPLCQVLKLP